MERPFEIPQKMANTLVTTHVRDPTRNIDILPALKVQDFSLESSRTRECVTHGLNLAHLVSIHIHVPGAVTETDDGFTTALDLICNNLVTIGGQKYWHDTSLSRQTFSSNLMLA
jgi:hypothetical protein